MGEEEIENFPLRIFIFFPQIRNLEGLVGFCLQSDKIHFIVHISCTTEMSQTQNPLTP